MAPQVQYEMTDSATQILNTQGNPLQVLAGGTQVAITHKLTNFCTEYLKFGKICENNELMGMLGFFFFSTIISLIFGIFRRCIFRCKTCCIYGTRSSRRKRMEEERQENEMFEKQMSSLQMRKQLLTRQQKSLQALMQGPQAQDVRATAEVSNGSQSHDSAPHSETEGTSNPQEALTGKLTELCNRYMKDSGICQSKELMGMLGFFLFSTIISLIFGIFRTCIFRCKTCCIYGTKSSRRKRMEEERQENEMFQQQMSSLQMRKQLLTKQQKSLQALMQGPQAQGKGKKKKKSSKKEPENSMNVFGVGYMPVSQ